LVPDPTTLLLNSPLCNQQAAPAEIPFPPHQVALTRPSPPLVSRPHPTICAFHTRSSELLPRTQRVRTQLFMVPVRHPIILRPLTCLTTPPHITGTPTSQCLRLSRIPINSQLTIKAGAILMTMMTLPHPCQMTLALNFWRPKNTPKVKPDSAHGDLIFPEPRVACVCLP